jgi:hypothetical protein
MLERALSHIMLGEPASDRMQKPGTVSDRMQKPGTTCFPLPFDLGIVGHKNLQHEERPKSCKRGKVCFVPSVVCTVGDTEVQKPFHPLSRSMAVWALKFTEHPSADVEKALTCMSLRLIKPF